MSLFLQPLLDIHEKLIVDLFAGGGGASSGIEQALGRMVDVAINHDPAAVSLHEANHPQTIHMTADVFEVCPRKATAGRPVGLLWASPDCTFHSKARGSKPIRSKTKKRRALAWVVTRWAGQVRPDVIALENVEEFLDWGPLVGKPDQLRPCKKRRGKTFKSWVRSLKVHGYRVEWRELRACDYGAPTIRKRLFLIARCDGQPIVWPEPTHGPGRKKPYRTAGECIDWSIPMCSIFATKEEAKAWGKAHGQPSPIRPLAENTMKRIARGVKRFVLDNPKPFFVTLAHGEESNGKKRWGKTERSTEEPMTTVKCSNGDAIVAPYLIPRYGEREGQAPRCRSVEEPAPVIVPSGNGASLVAGCISTYHQEKGGEEARGMQLKEPLHTLDCSNRHALVASFLGQYNGGFAEGNSGDGHELEQPSSTIVTKGPHQALITAFCNVTRNNGSDGYACDEPTDTVTATGAAHTVVAAHLTTFRSGATGTELSDPANTITANSFEKRCGGAAPIGLVAAHIQRDFGTSTGHKADEPLATITSDGGGKAGLVASFLSKFYGQGVGQALGEPAHTIPTVDRFGLVTVDVKGVPHHIEDIKMRMLQPRELYRCQGFRDGYIIDRGHDGRLLTKSEQVRMVGNSVSPPVAEAIVRANCGGLVAREKPRAKVAR